MKGARELGTLSTTMTSQQDSASVSQRIYVVFDSRAVSGEGRDDAAVLVVARSLVESREDAKGLGAVVCYSYRDDRGVLVEPRFEWMSGLDD